MMLPVLNTYRHIISNRSYFPLWLGQLVSNFGDTLNYVALVVLVYQLSQSGLAVSITVVFEIVPVLLLAPVAGVIIDRFPRKTILIASDLVRALLVVALIFATATWQVYLLAASLVAAGVFFNPTVQAVIPAIVERDLLLAANSVSWTTGRLVQIMASALAGSLIVLFGPVTAFAINSLTFIFSALMIMQLSIPAQVGEINRANRRGLTGLVTDMQAGLRYALQDRFISRLLIVQALSSLAVGATSALLVVLAEQHLKLPPAGFAWLLLAIGGGALMGPILFGSFIQNYRHVRYLFLPYIIRGTGDILIALITPLPVALFILFVYGLNTSIGMVVYNSLLQSEVEEEVRGRVYTLFDMVWNSMRLLSLALGGLLVDLWGVRVVFYTGGGLLVVAGVSGLLLLKLYKFKPAEETKAAA